MAKSRQNRQTGPLTAMGIGGALVIASWIGGASTSGADEQPSTDVPVSIFHESGGATTTTVAPTTTVAQSTTTALETTTTAAVTTTTIETTTTTTPEATTTTAPASTTTTSPKTTTTAPSTTTSSPEATTTTVVSTSVAEVTTTMVPTTVAQPPDRPDTPLAFTGSSNTTVALIGGALFLSGLSLMVARAAREQRRATTQR